MGWGDLWDSISEGASDLYDDAKGMVKSSANKLSQIVNNSDEAAFGDSKPGFSDKNREFLIKQYDRMKMGDTGISEDEFIDNMWDFSSKTRHMESDNNPNARAKTTSASGLYQFTDDSINTGRQRMQNMGWEKEDYEGIGDDATQWTPEQADAMFLSNMFAQGGSDEYLSAIGGGDKNMQKEAYYKFHHTDPDIATTNRADEIFGGHQDLGEYKEISY